jgi:hypothetical protein
MNHRKRHGPHVSKYSFNAPVSKKKDPTKTSQTPKLDSMFSPFEKSRMTDLLHRPDFSNN